MTNYSVKTVDEFVAAAPEVARPHLETLRKAVKTALPEADELIGYGKPYYKYHGWLVGFDFYTNHVTFEVYYGYGQFGREDRKLLEDLGYKTGSKTFQIRYDQDVPMEIVAQIVKAQAEFNKSRR